MCVTNDELHDSSKISESLCDLKNQLHSQHDDSSSKNMLARLEDIQRDIHASNRHLESLVSRHSGKIHINPASNTKRVKVGFQSMLFSFSVEFSSEHGSQPTEIKTVVNAPKKKVCTIGLPTWFVQDQYNLTLARSKNGWLYHPSVYRIVDFDSPFFEACRDGNLEQMKMLLTTKQAFLGDRMQTRTAGSALDQAMSHGQFEACKLLVNAGILSLFQSSDYTEVLEGVFCNMSQHRKESREILRLIEQEQNLDPDWIDDLDIERLFYKGIRDLRFYAEDIGVSDLAHLEALVFPTMDDIAIYNGDLEAEVHRLSEFLEEEDHVREIRATASRSTWLLFAIAHKIFKTFCQYKALHPPENVVKSCRFALTVICGTKLDIHAYMEGLPEDWTSVLSTAADTPIPNITAFAFIIAYWISWNSPDYLSFERINEAINLWVDTLHDAGVDLAAYAQQEVWTINKILMRLLSEREITCRLLHGPKPDDWRIEAGPPGEAHPAYFWRSVEATPISEELATKVLDLIRRLKNSNTVQCDIPGSWQPERDEPTWDAKGWLACTEDSDMAQMEMDLEQLDDESFYEEWDLGSVIKEWPYTQRQGWRDR
jgi:hypothetical protein